MIENRWDTREDEMIVAWECWQWLLSECCATVRQVSTFLNDFFPSVEMNTTDHWALLAFRMFNVNLETSNSTLQLNFKTKK